MPNNNKDAVITKLKRGDLSTLEQIYDGFYDKIYNFIFFKVRDQFKAEDLCSEVFFKFVDFVKKQDQDIDNVNAILYRIARNLIIDDSRKIKESYVGDEYLDSIVDKDTIGELSDDFINNENLLEIISSLKDDYRNVIVMYYMNEMTIKEIADVFEKNQGAVRTMLSRAIGSVKEKIKDKR